MTIESYVYYIYFFHLRKVLKKLSKFLSSSVYSNFCTPPFPSFCFVWPVLNLQERLIEDKSESLWHHHVFRLNFAKNKFFIILKNEEALILKLGKLIEYYIGNILMELIFSKSRPLFFFSITSYVGLLHRRGNSLSHSMLIAAYYLVWPEVHRELRNEIRFWPRLSIGFEPGLESFGQKC